MAVKIYNVINKGVRISDGLQNTTLKDGNYYVRAVRWVEV